MGKRIFTFIAAMFIASICFAGDYNYVDPAEVNSNIENGVEQIIVDICNPQQYAEGHLPGSIETNAYPVKSDSDRAKLDKVLSIIMESSQDVVIVCPGGKGGAKRTYDYLKERGVAESRLKILKGGMNNYSYRTESA